MRAITGNAYILLTLTSLCWAGNAIAGQLARGHISPQMLTSFRWLLVAVLLGVFYHRELRRHLPVITAHRWMLIAMAAIGFTGFNSLFYIASTKTGGINIGILQGSIPVFVMLGAFFTFGTTVGPLQATGVLCTLTGVMIVASQGDPGRLLGLQVNTGDLIMLSACVLYSGYTVALKRRPPLPGIVFMAVLAIIAAIASLPLLAVEIVMKAHVYPSLQGWLVTLFVAIFPSFVAQVSFIRGVELIGPGRAGIFVNLVPVLSALLAVLVLSERFHPYHATALGLVLLGIWIAERKSMINASQSPRSTR